MNEDTAQPARLRRAVIDPALPQKGRELLEAHREVLANGARELAPRPGTPRKPRGIGIGPGLVGIGAAGMVAAGAMSAAGFKLWPGAGLYVALLWSPVALLALVLCVCGAADASAARRERHPGPARGQARALRDAVRRNEQHYVTGQHLDAHERMLLRRAQNAADAITRSRIYQENIIDRVAVNADLAEKEWFIASTLRKLTEMRHGRRIIAPALSGRGTTPEALARILQAEPSSEQYITSMVKDLEASAAKARETDMYYAALELSNALAGAADHLRASIAAHKQQPGRLGDLAVEIEAARLELRRQAGAGTEEHPGAADSPAI